MRKIVLDFVFDERSGDTRIVVGYEDPDLSTLELNEAIRDGRVRDEIIALAETMFGQDIAGRLRDGRIPLVCTDHHPELLDQPAGVPLPQAGTPGRKQEQKQ